MPRPMAVCISGFCTPGTTLPRLCATPGVDANAPRPPVIAPFFPPVIPPAIAPEANVFAVLLAARSLGAILPSAPETNVFSPGIGVNRLSTLSTGAIFFRAFLTLLKNPYSGRPVSGLMIGSPNALRICSNSSGLTWIKIVSS